MNSREKVEELLSNIIENTVIEASCMYASLADDMTEAAFYKMLERFCKNGLLVHLTNGLYYKPKKSRFGNVPIREQDIVSHYTENLGGLVVGYKLYNSKGLTTQIGKQTEVFSNRLQGQRKTIQNVVVRNISCDLNEDRVAMIETFEILQNYSKIEDINNKVLIAYMEKFAQAYSDNEAMYVIEHMKYKKATISFLETFLNHFHITNSLRQYLSSMSVYTHPTMEEIYEIT